MNVHIYVHVAIVHMYRTCACMCMYVCMYVYMYIGEHISSISNLVNSRT